MKEKSLEALVKGKNVYEPPRFMSVAVAARQIMDSLVMINESDGERIPTEVLSSDTLCIGMARVGSESQQIKSGSLLAMSDVDLGAPLHSLVVPGHLHPMEEEMLTLLERQEQRVKCDY